MEEIWKSVRRFESYYEVSNMGNVRSIDRIVKRGRFFEKRKSHLLSVVKSSGTHGYCFVNLYKDGKTYPKKVHRLVADAFIENPDNKPCIDHINGLRDDNRVENLRWVTYKENANNPITYNKCLKNTYTKEVTKKALDTWKKKGGKGAPKTVYQYTKDGEFIAEYYSGADAARVTGICHTNIIDACNLENKTAGGYFWTYNKKNICKRELPILHNTKKIVVYDKNWNFIKEFDSIVEASKFTGILPSCIVRSTKTKKPKGKYGFRYKGQPI